MLTKKTALVSFSSTLCAFARGEITAVDLEADDLVLCCHCSKEHVLPTDDSISYEILWVGDTEHPNRHGDQGHLVPIRELPANLQETAKAWNRIMWHKWHQGQIYFRIN